LTSTQPGGRGNDRRRAWYGRKDCTSRGDRGGTAVLWGAGLGGQKGEKSVFLLLTFALLYRLRETSKNTSRDEGEEAGRRQRQRKSIHRREKRPRGRNVKRGPPTRRRNKHKAGDGDKADNNEAKLFSLCQEGIHRNHKNQNPTKERRRSHQCRQPRL